MPVATWIAYKAAITCDDCEVSARAADSVTESIAISLAQNNAAKAGFEPVEGTGRTKWRCSECVEAAADDTTPTEEDANAE